MQEIHPSQVPAELKCIPTLNSQLIKTEETENDEKGVVEPQYDSEAYEYETPGAEISMASSSKQPSLDKNEPAENQFKGKTGWQNRCCLMLAYHSLGEWCDLHRVASKFENHEMIYKQVNKLKAAITLYGPDKGPRKLGFTW